MPVRITSISDTHNGHDELSLPEGDILFHAGDSTNRGTEKEIRAHGEWARKQPYKYVVEISGNHDFGFQDYPDRSKEWFYGDVRDPRVHYLQDSGITLNISGQDIKIWGTPWQPVFHNWAFNAYPDVLKEKFALIPEDTDILIVHGPPYKLQDLTNHGHVGSRELRQRIDQLKLKLVICGHIHEDNGVVRYNKTLVANSAICNRFHDMVNPYHQFEIDDNGTLSEAPKVQGKEEAKEPV